eukprot:XP_011447487.1 PREDICTED: uncharacterized protein LOC105342287 [Crassostrea gigas]
MDIFRYISLNTLTFSIVLANVLSIRSLKTSGVCKQHGGLYRCCSNFRQEGQNCIPCVGSFGINCSGRCPERFFGFGCLGRCNCSEDQICDSRDGCMEDKIRQYEESTRIYLYIIILLCAIIICLLVALVAVSIKRKFTTSRHYQHELVHTDTPGEYTSTEHQGYLECVSGSGRMLENSSLENQFEELQSSNLRSTHYEYTNPRLFPSEDKTFYQRENRQEIHPTNNTEPPVRADVWRSIKDNVKKNRERSSVLRILSSRISLHETNHSGSYISVIDENPHA